MEEAAQNVQYVDVHPVKKSKRAILFLADFFLTFILALLLFHTATYPLGRVIAHYDEQMNALHDAQQRRDGLLYDNGLLFVRENGGQSVDDFELNLSYTSDCYIHSQVDPMQQASYDVFANYFVKERSDEAALVSFYQSLDERYGFFEYPDGHPRLKASYVEEFLPAFDPKDTMSSKGQEDYQTFEDKIFVQGYARLLNALEERDFTKNGISYATEQQTISSVLSNGRMLIVTCSFATFFLCWALLHLLLPSLNKKRKTIAMMMLRLERVNQKDFEPFTLPKSYLHSLYGFAGYAIMPLFIPWGSTNFNELFSLPILFPLVLFGLAYLLGSFGFLLFDSYNRTLGDFLCRGYCMGADDFDIMVAQKGYKA